MPLVFKTAKDTADDVQIAGVGILGAGAAGGVPVHVAAETMTELQDDEGKPLTGSALTAAAKRLAETHGWETVNVHEDKLAGLAVEAGAAPDRPPLEDVGREEYEATFGGLETVNDEPDDPDQIEGNVGAGVPATPDHQED